MGRKSEMEIKKLFFKHSLRARIEMEAIYKEYICKNVIYSTANNEFTWTVLK